jgi:hypothetical protein
MDGIILAYLSDLVTTREALDQISENINNASAGIRRGVDSLALRWVRQDSASFNLCHRFGFGFLRKTRFQMLDPLFQFLFFLHAISAESESIINIYDTFIQSAHVARW